MGHTVIRRVSEVNRYRAACTVGGMASTSSLLNFPYAARLAGVMAPAGPRLSAAEQRRAVESLRYAAVASVDHVHAITGLSAAHNLHDSEVLVVDRASWAKANTQSFSMMLSPLENTAAGQRLTGLSPSQQTLTGYVGGGELAAVLAYLSTRVLGQYEPYAALAGHGAPGGRLMLVAPNILALEKELTLDPEDFRLWVCLHEQTHRVQFAAAGWLRAYLLERIRELAAVVDETPLLHSRGRAGEVLSRITAVMSLLEGHANVVMDRIDPSIVPTVKTIRRRFSRRSETQKILTRLISTVLGLERKLQQYRDGQKFVQHIVDAEGMERFNAVWDSPQNLPTEAELHDPQVWIRRVLVSERAVED